ncbi:MAG TPA: PP2C family protein-serine/threonine phosphatase [Thermoanaerobaculia bacterium]|nr:PP2C family protein-serine/threonine phosphatase [Thermoanaerobaculia bacterium]
MPPTPQIPPQLLAELRGDLLPLFVAAIALTVGAASVALAVAGRPRDRTLLFFGVTGGLYGIRLLLSLNSAGTLFGIAAGPRRLCIAAISYCILVPFVDFLSRLAPARWHTALRRLIAADLACALAGLAFLAWRRDPRPQSLFFSALALLNVAVVLLALLRPGEPPTWELRRLRTAFGVFAFFVLCDNLRAYGILVWPQFAEGLGLLVFVGGLGSIAARQFFAGRSRLAALRQELETARAIQSSLLPAALPRLPGLDLAVRYVPAAEVAGDLYDFLPAPGNRLGVLLADVSGHGVPAALVASMVKIAAAAQAADAAAPGKMLTGMSHIFHRRLRTQFITATYLCLDLDAGSLRWASAGHPPPLLLRRGRVRELKSAGPILGRLARSDYAESRTSLEAGDRLVVFSDGIPEAAAPSGELFGDDRLQVFLAEHGQLSPDAFAGALLSRLEEWSHPGPPGASPDRGAQGFADDLTLVVLAVTGAGPDAPATGPDSPTTTT